MILQCVPLITIISFRHSIEYIKNPWKPAAHKKKVTKLRKPEEFSTVLQNTCMIQYRHFFLSELPVLYFLTLPVPDHDKNRFQGKLEGFELPWYSVREVTSVSKEDRPCWMQHRTVSSL